MASIRGWRGGVAAVLGLSMAAVAGQSTAASPVRPAIADLGTFFVGGHYAERRQGHDRPGPHPLPDARQTPAQDGAGIHSRRGQTITNFLSTPDGRPGWAKQFVDQGWAVYLMDKPGRGASGYDQGAYGPANRQPPDFVAKRFTAAAGLRGRRTASPRAGPGQAARPVARDRPGRGEPGDPIFDQFYASRSPARPAGSPPSWSPTPARRCSTRSAPGRGHHPFAVGRVRLGDRRGAAGPGQGHRRGRAQRPAFFGAPPPWGDSDPDKPSRPGA